MVINRTTEGIIIVAALIVFGLKVFLIFLGWIAIRSGKIKGKKYRDWTPRIVLEPTGVNERYRALQIRTIVTAMEASIPTRCFFVIALFWLSAKKRKRMRKTMI